MRNNVELKAFGKEDRQYASDEGKETFRLSTKAKESIKARLKKRTVGERAAFAETISKDVAKTLDVTIEDCG